MKRILIIMSLAALLVMPLILVGCGGGTTLTESDVATIQGFGKRLDDHDKSIGELQGKTTGLDADTLAKLAALDPDKLTALANLDLETLLDDVAQAKDDIATIQNPDVAGSLPDVVKRLKDLEDEEANDGGTPSGKVMVALNEDSPFEVYTDEDMTSPPRFTVTITNGTEDWKAVSYCVNFTCVSVDGKAVVTAAGLTASASSYGGVGVSFNVSYVPDTAPAWLVFFTPKVDFEVVVSPGKTTTVYHAITLETTGFELWEVTLTGVTVKKL